MALMPQVAVTVGRRKFSSVSKCHLGSCVKGLKDTVDVLIWR
jgi:hypothetical protein